MLKEIVTLTLSSFKINCSGGGRKSLMTLTSPIGSSVYFIFRLINLPPFSPITRAEDPDYITTTCKSHSQDFVIHLADTIEPAFLTAVSYIFCNNPARIKECMVGCGKRDMMLGLVLSILILVPLKAGFFHTDSVLLCVRLSNIKIWLSVWLSKCKMEKGVSENG